MTKTSSFGVGKRQSHDASAFYARGISKVSESTDTTVNTLPPDLTNRIYCHTSEDMHELPDNSVGLMVTSPPYFAGKDLQDDPLLSWEGYLKMLRNVFKETYRVLEPGARAVVNVANLGRRPYVSLVSEIHSMMGDIGFLSRGEIIWIKARGASGSCAFGTFMSPKSPALRDLHEYILIYDRGRFGRIRKGQGTITKEEFMKLTLSLWEFPPESAKRVGHPAPFPVELPRRAIELYSYDDDVILDPFMGSGSTAIAAMRTGRDFVGYELQSSFVEVAGQRFEAERRIYEAARRIAQ